MLVHRPVIAMLHEHDHNQAFIPPGTSSLEASPPPTFFWSTLWDRLQEHLRFQCTQLSPSSSICSSEDVVFRSEVEDAMHEEVQEAQEAQTDLGNANDDRDMEYGWFIDLEGDPDSPVSQS